MLILGLDPGLSACTGWGVIGPRATGSAMSPTARSRPTPPRRWPSGWSRSPAQLSDVIADHRPGAAAVEEVFVNKNPHRR